MPNQIEGSVSGLPLKWMEQSDIYIPGLLMREYTSDMSQSADQKCAESVSYTT